MEEYIIIDDNISLRFSPNKKRVILKKKQGRRITTPISILKIAVENKIVLDAGEIVNHDTSWNIKIADWAGIDYVCFEKLADDSTRAK